MFTAVHLFRGYSAQSYQCVDSGFSPRQGLLCGNFVRSCSPLRRLLSWLFAFLSKRYLATNPSSLLHAFCPDKGYFAVILFYICSPRQGLITGCSLPAGYSYLGICSDPSSLLDVFCLDTGYSMVVFVLQLFAQTRFNQLAVRFPQGIAT